MTNRLSFKKPVIRRKTRTDHILHLKQKYDGDLHDNPEAFNRAFANVMRAMADALDKIDNAWADPELVVWTHEPGLITAELPLSAPIKRRRGKAEA